MDCLVDAFCDVLRDRVCLYTYYEFLWIFFKIINFYRIKGTVPSRTVTILEIYPL